MAQTVTFVTITLFDNIFYFILFIVLFALFYNPVRDYEESKKREKEWLDKMWKDLQEQNPTMFK